MSTDSRKVRKRATHPRGMVVVTTVESRALRNNPLGDPAVRHIPVYLPPGYDDDPATRYPVLYALTGFTGSGRMLLNVAAWAEPLNERLDRLQAEGSMGAMIVVMPDCFTRWGGSQYINSSATGRYEEHLLREVVPHIDREFRTLAEAQHRGVFGKSSGGYGALIHGMRHPDLFAGVACHSGDMGFELCYWPDLPKLQRQIEKHGGVERFVRAFEAAPRKSQSLVEAMNMLAMAACYSPKRGKRPFGIEFPIDLRSGEVDARVWRAWLRHDPLRQVTRFAANLRRLRLLYVDCGTRDEFNLHLGARQLVEKLRRLRIRHVHEEFDDGHMSVSYRYDRSLPRLWSALRPRSRKRRPAG
jgi:enterochelin esterase family protein